MKIQLTIYPNGGFECFSKNCRHKKECANHATAGDFRYESGLSPRLKITSIFLGGANAECYSAHHSIIDNYQCGAKRIKFIKNRKIKIKFISLRFR